MAVKKKAAPLAGVVVMQGGPYPFDERGGRMVAHVASDMGTRGIETDGGADAARLSYNAIVVYQGGDHGRVH